MPIHKKKRIFESGRPAANTKLGDKKIKKIRVRGGNFKFRALRLNQGNYNWTSEGVAFKTKIVNVVYNASNNELVRTATLVKNTIVRVDATPFKKHLIKHYFGVENPDFKIPADWVGTEAPKKVDPATKKEIEDKFFKRRTQYKIDPKIIEQINKGFILACISSRPGQSGRADGYVLEGKELEFYVKRADKK